MTIPLAVGEDRGVGGLLTKKGQKIEILGGGTWKKIGEKKGAGVERKNLGWGRGVEPRG